MSMGSFTTCGRGFIYRRTRNVPTGDSLAIGRVWLYTIFPLLLLLASSPRAFAAAADQTWDGGGTDNNWSSNANWVGDNNPANNDGVIFAGTTRLTNTNNNNNFTYRLITFN